MKRTAEEIIQELQDQLIIQSKKVKQAEQKHFSNVMSCGHGQYPKHFEIKTSAEYLKESLEKYLAYKKLLDLIERYTSWGENNINYTDLILKLDELRSDPVLSNNHHVDSVFMEFRTKLLCNL